MSEQTGMQADTEQTQINLQSFVEVHQIVLQADGRLDYEGEQYQHLVLIQEDRSVEVAWNGDGIPATGEVLDYLALVAESVEETSGPEEWLEVYGDVFCRDAVSPEVVETIYRECVSDMLRLRYLLGDEAYVTLLHSVEPYSSPQ